MKNIILLILTVIINSCGSDDLVYQGKTPSNPSGGLDEVIEKESFVSAWYFEDNPNITTDDKNWNELILPLKEKDINGKKLVYDFVVDWGDGQTSKVKSFNDPNRIHTYANEGEYIVTITGTLQGWSLNQGRDSYKIIRVEEFGDLDYRDLSGAFAGATKLYVFRGGKTHNVISMKNMFAYNEKLALPDTTTFDTSNVTDLSYMFQYCMKINAIDLTHFNISKVTNVNGMFYNIPGLEYVNVEGWDISSIDLSNFMPIGLLTNPKMDIYCNFKKEPYASYCK